MAPHTFFHGDPEHPLILSLTQSPSPHITLRDPGLFPEGRLYGVHSEQYVRALQTGISSDGFTASGIPWTPALYRRVVASVAALSQATKHAMLTGLSGALAPDGSLAGLDGGKGTQVLNSLLLAALNGRGLGAREVLIFDTHAQSSTAIRDYLLRYTDIRYFGVETAPEATFKSSVRARNFVAPSADVYLATITEALHEAGTDFALVVYHASAASFERMPETGMPGITPEVLALRDARVFRHFRERKIPVAYAVGHAPIEPDLQDLVTRLHRVTIAEAASCG